MKRIAPSCPATGMPFGWIGRTAGLAARAGFNVREALATVGVTDAGDLVRNETLLDPAEFLLLCALLINAFDDELHGIGRTRMARGTASMVAKAIASERDLAGAIETISRFLRMVGSECRIRLNGSAQVARVEVAVNGEERLTVVVEELMCHFLQHQFSFFLGFPLPLSAFTTRGEDHPFVHEVHPYLRCAVNVANVTTLSFSAKYLHYPSQARIDVGPLWDAQMMWLSHLSPVETNLMDASRQPVSCAILDQLANDDAPFEVCCAELRVTVHELKRALALEGTSFRKLRRAALTTRARPHLIAGATADDLAEMLGYSDARSLRRALKLATGQSMAELRRAQSDGGVAQAAILGQLRSQALQMA